MDSSSSSSSSSEQYHQHRHRKSSHVISVFFSFSFLLFIIFFFYFSYSTLPHLHYSFTKSHHTILLQSTPNPKHLQLQHRILFPDHLLLTLTNPYHTIPSPTHLQCVYYNLLNSSSSQLHPVFDVQTQPVLSTHRLDHSRSAARCPLPKTNFSAVDLRRRGEAGTRSFTFLVNQTVQNWDKLAYEAAMDGDTVVVFVKGLNLRPHRISDPSRFNCHFGLNNLHRNGAFWALTTEAVTVAQEVVRCSLPHSIKTNPEKAQGISVTVSHVRSHPVREIMPSVASIAPITIETEEEKKKKKKHELCACTMVWNQARALKEWVTYHAWLGVERWFIYDNNSDDEIERVVNDLDQKGYNVTTVAWPWIKTQEAGFSHCVIKAKQECNWVGFFDVDEFFYFPGEPKQSALKSMVSNFSESKSIAEIRTGCHNFGPSGLTSHPKKGVTLGYTCRLQSTERHKSIVRPELIDSSLLNVVHHFQLKEGFGYKNMGEKSVVINHYKYQVWESFKDKFLRRVATYVVDWHEDQNKGSKDRAPGLGTEAIEPPEWRFRFCEVWDNGLRDFVVSSFADPDTGLMPWEDTTVL